jgi:hypothetical protein
MPIQRSGWELLIVRLREDRRNGRRRTVGQYQVFHDGSPVPGLSGMCAETRGPGDNSKAGNNRRIGAGRYPLRTQNGKKYVIVILRHGLVCDDDKSDHGGDFAPDHRGVPVGARVSSRP